MNITPKAVTHKDKQRILEHGSEWECIQENKIVHFDNRRHSLLKSISTGYERWWPTEQCK